MKSTERQPVKPRTGPRRPPPKGEGSRRRSAPLLDHTTARPVADDLTKGIKSGAGYEDLITAVGTTRSGKPQRPDTETSTTSMIPREPAKAPADPSMRTKDEPLRRRAKMRVSSPADPAEREAEAVATKVAAAPKEKIHGVRSRTTSTPDDKIQRSHTFEEEKDPAGSPAPLRRADSGAEATPVEPQGGVDEATRRSIDGERGRGQPLPDGLRSEMEDKFGERFGAVRIHDDANANTLCSQRLTYCRRCRAEVLHAR